MRDEPTGQAPEDEVTRALTGLDDDVVMAATDDIDEDRAASWTRGSRSPLPTSVQRWPLLGRAPQ